MAIQYTKRGRRIMAILLPTLFVNFFSFIAGVLLLGGDAWHGSIEDGQYFVSYRGAISEVASWQWIYSYVHSGLVIANFLAFVVVFYWLWISGDIDP